MITIAENLALAWAISALRIVYDRSLPSLHIKASDRCDHTKTTDQRSKRSLIHFSSVDLDDRTVHWPYGGEDGVPLHELYRLCAVQKDMFFERV